MKTNTIRAVLENDEFYLNSRDIQRFLLDAGSASWISGRIMSVVVERLIELEQQFMEQK